MDSHYDCVVEVLISLLLLHNKPTKYTIVYILPPFLLPYLDMHENEKVCIILFWLLGLVITISEEL